jgi:hypothetical protein
MTLDTLRRGRWTLPSIAVAVNAMPLMLLTALRGVAAIDPGDPSLIMIHVVLTQVNMWVFGVAVLSSQGPVSKLFTLPVTTATIVFWRMLALVILAALQSLLSTLMINALFGVDWPLWGPALLLAVSMAGAQAILWYADKSAWVIVMLAALALIYGGWMQSRYGGVLVQPDHYWREISLADAAFMLTMLGFAFALGVAGVARLRRGEPPLSLGIIDAIHRALQGKHGAAAPFRSPIAAQFWYEWRKKGWVMPVGASFGLLLAFFIWSIFNRDPGELWEGIFGLGACLTILGFIGGLILGHNGPNDTSYDLGGFLATRPLTTTTLANILLKACGLSVLLAWLMWVAAYAGVYVVLRATQATPLSFLPNELSWWYYPLTLLGPWVAVTLVASVGLSGRATRFIVIGGGLFAAWIAVNIAGKYAIPPEHEQILNRGFIVLVSALFVLGTLAAFIAAVRRGLIRWPAVYVAGTLWLALTAGAMFTLANQLTPLQSLVSIAVAGGIFALAVAPLATAPLALAWNRTR